MATWKKVLVIVGVLLGVLMVGALVAVLMFPAERVAALAAAQAEASLDRQVRIESVRLRLFPRPAAELEGVAVSRHARPGLESGDPGAAFAPLLASVEAVQLRPRLLPLLRGDVIINELVVERPHLLLEIPEGGTLDLPTIEGGDEPATGDTELEIRRMILRNGTVEYRDANTGTEVIVEGIDHSLRLSASVLEGELSVLELDGDLTIARLDVEAPDALPARLRDLAVRVEHDAVLHQADHRLEIRTADVSVEEFPLAITGTVEALGDPEARTVELTGAAHDVDVARLVASLPPDLRERLPEGPDGRTLTGTAGTVTVDAAARGRAGGGEVPEVEGLLQLASVALGYEGGSDQQLVSDLSGEVAFTSDSAATDGLEATVLGEPARVAFAVQNFREPQGTFSGSGALLLEEAERAGLLPEGATASGRIGFDLTGGGSTAEPETISVDGWVDLGGLELDLAEIGPRIAVAPSRVSLEGDAVLIQNFAVTMGRSDLTLDAQALGWPAGLLGDEGATPPSVTFQAHSRFLDVDELLDIDPNRPSYGQLLWAHAGGLPIDGRSAAEVAAEEELSLPDVPRLRANGGLTADRLLSGGVEYSLVDVPVEVVEREIIVEGATLEAMGGQVRLSGRLGPSPGGEEAPRPFSLDYDVAGVTANAFLERHTLFRGRVGGSLETAGSLDVRLHPNTLPVRETLSGDGSIVVRDGELVNWPLVRELGQRLGLPDFQTLQFRDWGGAYRIVDATVFVEESTLEAGDLQVSSVGSFDVEGNLDFTATLYLPGAWLDQIPGVPTNVLESLLGGPEERVPVAARVTGTTSSPSIGLDLSEAGDIAAERAREEAEEAVRDQAERFLDRLRGRRDTLDADTLDADTIQGDTVRADTLGADNERR